MFGRKHKHEGQATIPDLHSEEWKRMHKEILENGYCDVKIKCSCGKIGLVLCHISVMQTTKEVW